MDAFVARHLQGVSRTYAILVPMLPPPLADAVGLAYLVMRIVDTVEDDPQLTADERRRYFAVLAAALGGDAAAAQTLAQPLGDNDDERALMVDAPEVLARVRALPMEQRTALADCARAMMVGVQTLMARSAARGVPYPAVCDVTELREYCYYVAGVVGEMLCALMAGYLRQPGLLERRAEAVELGTGLQLVNILKDARDDAEHGRRYLPIVADGAAAARVYQEVLEEARRSLERGIAYVLALPATQRALRSFCGLPIAWGALTLARAQRDSTAAKIGRAAIRDTIAQFETIAGDDQRLRQYLGGLLTS